MTTIQPFDELPKSAQRSLRKQVFRENRHLRFLQGGLVGMAVLVSALLVQGAFPISALSGWEFVFFRLFAGGLVAGTLAYVFLCAVVEPKIRVCAARLQKARNQLWESGASSIRPAAGGRHAPPTGTVGD